jgi:TPR repeat protein
VYLNGEGVVRDFAQAIHWLEKAAHQGDAVGQHALGKMCSFGIGMAIDRKRGFELFLRAADRGLDEAQYDVGMAYAEGKVVPLDIARATHWFCLGAAQGQEKCQLQLLLMRDMGVNIPKDANLGRWASMESDEAGPEDEALSGETDASDDEVETVSEEYLAHLLAVLDNYKSAARKEAQP